MKYSIFFAPKFKLVSNPRNRGLNFGALRKKLFHGKWEAVGLCSEAEILQDLNLP